MHNKTFYTQTKNFHSSKFAQTKNVTCAEIAFVFLCTVQICDFCIWKKLCAADLRILCTTVFRTFAHLHIYTFAHLHICEFTCADFFLHVQICKNNFSHVRIHEFYFLRVFCRILTFCQNLSKSRKSRNFRKCPILSRRFLTCSRKCPKKAHVFLSGTRVVPGPTRWQHRVAKVARICIN